MKKTKVDPQTLVGKTVTWTSQARGSKTTKTGEVLGFVPKHKNIRSLFLFLCDIPSSQCKVDASTSSVDRYLIKVPRVETKGQELTPWYYAPRANPDLFSVVEANQSSNQTEEQ